MKKLVFFSILASVFMASCSFAKEFGIRYDSNTTEKNVLPIVVTYYLCTPATGQTACNANSTKVGPYHTNMLSNGQISSNNLPAVPNSSIIVATHIDVYESSKDYNPIMSKDFTSNECSATSYLDVLLYGTDQDGYWNAKFIKCNNLG